MRIQICFKYYLLSNLYIFICIHINCISAKMYDYPPTTIQQNTNYNIIIIIIIFYGKILCYIVFVYLFGKKM